MKDMVRNDLMRGMYDLIILSCIINTKENITQYRLISIIKEKAESSISINNSTIYDAVRRLKKQNYIDKDSKELIITEDGLVYYNCKIAEWHSICSLMSQFTLKND